MTDFAVLYRVDIPLNGSTDRSHRFAQTGDIGVHDCETILANRMKPVRAHGLKDRTGRAIRSIVEKDVADNDPLVTADHNVSALSVTV